MDDIKRKTEMQANTHSLGTDETEVKRKLNFKSEESMIIVIYGFWYKPIKK